MAICKHNNIASKCTQCLPIFISEEIPNTVSKIYRLKLTEEQERFREMKELLASYRSSLDQIKQIAINEMYLARTQIEHNAWVKVRILSE